MTEPAAPLQVLLLRGVNVGGHRKIGMPALARLLGDLGCEDVRTYFQSGNAVLRPGGVGAAEIGAALERHLGFPVGTTLCPAPAWQGMAAGNPYRGEAEQDGSKVHLAVLGADPDAEGVASLRAVPRGPDGWTLCGRALYLHLPNGAGRTRLDHATLERRLGVAVTVRNWRTVAALDELLGPAA